jgi:hypothetical protein
MWNCLFRVGNIKCLPRLEDQNIKSQLWAGISLQLDIYKYILKKEQKIDIYTHIKWLFIRCMYVNVFGYPHDVYFPYPRRGELSDITNLLSVREGNFNLVHGT